MLHGLLDSILIKADAETTDSAEQTWLDSRVSAGIQKDLGENNSQILRAVNNAIAEEWDPDTMRTDIGDMQNYLEELSNYLRETLVPQLKAVIKWAYDTNGDFATDYMDGKIQDDAIAGLEEIPSSGTENQ